MGVDFFFVLSGFLITGILWSNRDQARRLRDFYGRRILRIWPLYYGTLAVLLLYALWHRYPLHWLQLLWLVHLGNYAFYFGKPFNPIDGHWDPFQLGRVGSLFAHLWSLCIEEQFYLAWPLVVYRVRSRRALIWVCAVGSSRRRSAGYGSLPGFRSGCA